MRTLMTGPVWLSYGQIYVESGGDFADLGECFGGQQNGLCGAAVAGRLTLMTGLHTGEVDFTAELHDQEPAIDDTWEDIVEASYRPAQPPTLSGLDSNDWWTLPLDLVDYRVRYSGWGMDAGHQAGPPMDDEPLVDRYLLQFWPAQPAPDRVVKQTSRQAAYWHGFAREQPTPAQLAERKQQKAREAEQQRLVELAAAYGGALPTQRIENTRHGLDLSALDRAFVDALEQTEPTTLRDMARWAARRACEEAGYAAEERIAGVLDRMDSGADWLDTLNGPQPPVEPGAEIRASSQFVARMHGWFGDRDSFENTSTVVTSTFSEDPFKSAVETIWLATGPFADKQRLLDELRREFFANRRYLDR
ncbi:hypothetical protein ACWGID_17455 [Kribbella sp. NPDC054772]